MSGELAPVLRRTWKEVWQPLIKADFAPPDMFSELLGELGDEPNAPQAPGIPPPDAFDGDGILVDPVHVKARANYDSALERYAAERSAYEVAVGGGDARPLFKSLLAHASLPCLRSAPSTSSASSARPATSCSTTRTTWPCRSSAAASR